MCTHGASVGGTIACEYVENTAQTAYLACSSNVLFREYSSDNMCMTMDGIVKRASFFAKDRESQLKFDRASIMHFVCAKKALDPFHAISHHAACYGCDFVIGFHCIDDTFVGISIRLPLFSFLSFFSSSNLLNLFDCQIARFCTELQNGTGTNAMYDSYRCITSACIV